MKKFVVFLVVISLSSCGEDFPSETNLSGEALGTTYHIKYYSEENLMVEPALDSIFDVINNSMSTYQQDSDISKINRGDSMVLVDEMFQEVFALSKKVYNESHGYFDPTVGNLVNLYGFGPEKGLQSPDSSSVDSLMRFVGLNKIQIDESGKVSKEHPDVYLDFNAIAKGYTIDVIGRYLDSKNIEDYLIELGGELLAKGKNQARAEFWTVGIDDPTQDEGQERTLKAVLELRNRAMATSGNYRKFRIDPETGEKFVHTINPLTGFPEKSKLLSATVLAENCTLADGYATAFMALGLERSVEVSEDNQDIDVYFLYTGETGEIEEHFSTGFEEVLKN